jgi:hypothetical protein
MIGEALDRSTLGVRLAESDVLSIADGEVSSYLRTRLELLRDLPPGAQAEYVEYLKKNPKQWEIMKKITTSPAKDAVLTEEDTLLAPVRGHFAPLQRFFNP